MVIDTTVPAPPSTPALPAVDMLPSALRSALAHAELFLTYQPIIELGTGRAAAVEALIRWRHPTLGVLPPAAFILDVERDDVIVEVGRWTLLTAAQQLAQWRALTPALDRLRMAVNLSAAHLQDDGVVEDVARALDASGLPSGRLIVEVTESTRITDFAAALRSVIGLRQLEVSVALDDFGSGYWGLDHVARLHPDVVKLDRRYVRGLSSSLSADGIVAEHILRLANARRISVIAEGVESPAQIVALANHSCRLAQGYLFAPPMTAMDARSWLERNAARGTEDLTMHGENEMTPLTRPLDLAPRADVGSSHSEDESRPSRLLLVEDSPSDALLLEEQLREDAVLRDAQTERATTLAAAEAALLEGEFDAVIADLGLPDSDGLETFGRIHDAAGKAAVVVVTGLNDRRIAEEAVRRGAQDYLVKGDTYSGELGRAVMYAIRRQQVLEELERARDEQLAAKDRFLSHVSHELRSPLSVVHQFASLLLDGVAGPLSSDQQEFLAVLMRNVGQLKVMIDDLLEVSRAQRGRVAVSCSVLNVNSLLVDAVAAFRPAAQRLGITLQLDAPKMPAVTADADRVREVLGNLLENALKFTRKGGSVCVAAAADPDFVTVSVRDTGCGIRDSDLDRIFEQFFQAEQGDETSRNGLGLGLFVSRDLIQRQGGRMWANSRLGYGTTIHVTLPRASGPQSEEA